MTLTDDVHAIVDPLPGRFGVYARNLTTGEVVDVNAARPQPTASAAKQFVLVTYAQHVAQGELDPDARIIEMPLRVYNKTGIEPNVCTDAALFVTTGAEWSRR
jgi:beta-lactamase class A